MGNKTLGYLRLKGLKETVLNPPVNNDSSREKNENAYAELIQFLDDRSPGLVFQRLQTMDTEHYKFCENIMLGVVNPE